MSDLINPPPPFDPTAASIAPTAPPTPALPATPAPPRVLNPYASRVQPAAPPPAVAAPSAPPSNPVAPDPVAALRADVDGLRGIIGRTVEQDLAAVPANVAAAVRASSADPIEQRRLLDVLRANGLANQPVSAPAPLPAPITTMPAAAPPAAPAEPTGDAAVLAEYTRLKSRGAHLSAAAFYASNAGAIERAQRTSPSN